jgi:hypothetical protein
MKTGKATLGLGGLVGWLVRVSSVGWEAVCFSWSSRGRHSLKTNMRAHATAFCCCCVVGWLANGHGYREMREGLVWSILSPLSSSPYFDPSLGRSVGRSVGSVWCGAESGGYGWGLGCCVLPLPLPTYLPPSYLDSPVSFLMFAVSGRGGALVVAGKRSKRESVSVSISVSYYSFFSFSF